MDFCSVNNSYEWYYKYIINLKQCSISTVFGIIQIEWVVGPFPFSYSILILKEKDCLNYLLCLVKIFHTCNSAYILEYLRKIYFSYFDS